MYPLVQPNTHIALRLPSESLKVLEIVPNTTISLGKYGSFPANLLIGRPYNLTFEVLDKENGQAHSDLRIVPATELHDAILADNSSVSVDVLDGKTLIEGGDGVEYELVGENGDIVMRSNKETIDDPSRQKLTMEEIEELKKEGSAGKEIIARLLKSHTALDQKTAFSLAKYTLRKSKKYVKRFTVLQLDVPLLTHYLLGEKEAAKTMDLREETLALIGSWANIHWSREKLDLHSDIIGERIGGGRWLIVDETGGLIVAAMAERMGILYPDNDEDTDTQLPLHNHNISTESTTAAHSVESALSGDATLLNGDTVAQGSHNGTDQGHEHHHHHRDLAMSATSNTLTILHSNAQPNLSLLKYYNFDASVRDTPSSHPLHKRLKTVSWLQLLSPEEDTAYAEPEALLPEVLQKMKGGKRGNYYKKRRRWERVKSVVDETRAGGFDGLIVASLMNPATIFQHTIPLLRGAAQVVVYSPYVETLTELADLYSLPRRTAFAMHPPASIPTEDFPVNPSLLLAPTIHTAKLRHWQCLPGRTHPMMTSRGGAEGYIFHATRVLPVDGKVEARGKNKRRKVIRDLDMMGQDSGEAAEE